MFVLLYQKASIGSEYLDIYFFKFSVSFKANCLHHKAVDSKKERDNQSMKFENTLVPLFIQPLFRKLESGYRGWLSVAEPIQLQVVFWLRHVFYSSNAAIHFISVPFHLHTAEKEIHICGWKLAKLNN